jgi:hypothetical protein
MRRMSPLSVWAPIAGALVACAPKAASGPIEAGVMSERPSSNGLTEQQVDVNGDGRADIWNFFEERTDGPRGLRRKELDLNWDGRVDVRTHFDGAGSIEREEMDGDFDGRVDWVDHYQGGKRVLTEVDTDYNGAFDLFKTYEQGVVRRKERDTNGDGKVDFWEYLDEKGAVLKTGKDLDADGVMDVRDE